MSRSAPAPDARSRENAYLVDRVFERVMTVERLAPRVPGQMVPARLNVDRKAHVGLRAHAHQHDPRSGRRRRER
jgi:hypothetical protein